MDDLVKDDLPHIASRLSARLRPEGWPVMYQSWGSLLFMHWRVGVESLRPLIPEPIQIDTFDGSAWLAVTPFTLWGARPIFTPPFPWISTFHEINVRTYVFLNGVPGVWFFSLDANSTLPVLAARALFHLPYHDAEIGMNNNGDVVDFSMKRDDAKNPANFKARWSVNDPLSESAPGTLAFFLTERYCLYTKHSNELFRCRISHKPWLLLNAELEYYETDLFESNSIPVPEGDPIVHGAGPVDVEVWPLERL
jgi:uncharacterized protein YqjF (DUF2071 family)